MFKDIMRQSKFGDDFGLIQRLIATGHKVDADSNFYSALADNEFLFRSIVEFVNKEMKNDPLRRKAARTLREAVGRGVQCENGIYRIYDPGISYNMLRSLVVVPQATRCAYVRYDWADKEEAPRERFLRFPVEGSRSEIYPKQVALLTSDEEVASARSVAMLYVIHALATGTYLQLGLIAQCVDVIPSGERITIAMYGKNDFSIGAKKDANREANTVLVASKK